MFQVLYVSVGVENVNDPLVWDWTLGLEFVTCILTVGVHTWQENSHSVLLPSMGSGFHFARGTSSFFITHHLGGMSAPSDVWCQAQKIVYVFIFKNELRAFWYNYFFPGECVCACLCVRACKCVRAYTYVCACSCVIWLWLEQRVFTLTCPATQHLNNFRL